MTIITRFAPSPTGMLHIGGARTALFNYLFAKNKKGKFLLRVEDTDVSRSTQEAVNAILDGLKWLGINWDDNIVYQASRKERHAEIAHKMVELGSAYYAYETKEELEEKRKQAESKGLVYKYDKKWRDNSSTMNTKPVIRLKVPLEGQTIVNDIIQGDVCFENTEIDDLILLRADGMPTYMLAVVVDDHDMQVTNIIRGNDHLTNTPKQILIYKAMGWDVPKFAHIPLIHNIEGKKLSKRDGATSTLDYKQMGYLPEALRNYLLRLGWSSNDKEIISDSEAINLFNLENVGKSPSRFDLVKLNSINSHYIQQRSNTLLIEDIREQLERLAGKALNKVDIQRLEIGLDEIKKRSSTLNEIIEISLNYISGIPFNVTDQAKEVISNNKEIIGKLLTFFGSSDFINIESDLKLFLECNNLKLGEVGPVLRCTLLGRANSIGIYSIIKTLGKEEVIRRMQDIEKGLFI